jgi:hypothetical protein
MRSMKDNIRSLAKARKRKGPGNTAKFDKVMHEWGQGELHSGSKKGPKVTNQKQAIAIAFSEARKAKKGK